MKVTELTRQREVFIALMDNYKRSLELTEIATNSNGKAAEKYEIYLQSLEAAMNKVKTTFETLFFSDGAVNTFKIALEGIVFALQALTKMAVPAGLVALTMFIKNFSTMNFAQSISPFTQAMNGLNVVQMVQLSNIQAMTPAMMAQKFATMQLTEAKIEELIVARGLTAEQQLELMALRGWNAQTIANTAIGKTFTATQIEQTIAINASKAALIAQGNSLNFVAVGLKNIWAAMLASPLFWITAISAAVASIVWFFDEQNKAVEKAAENLKKLSDEYKQLNSDLEKGKTDLEKINKQIAEIQSKGKISLMDETELQKLRDAAAELERQNAALKIQLDQKEKDANEAGENQLKNFQNDYYANASIDILKNGENSGYFDSEYMSIDKEVESRKYYLTSLVSEYQKIIDSTNGETKKKAIELRNDLLKIIDPSWAGREIKNFTENEKNTKSLDEFYAKIKDGFVFDEKTVTSWEWFSNLMTLTGLDAKKLYDELVNISKVDPVKDNSYDIKTILPDISKTVSDLKDAKDEMENSGSISTATFEKLIELDAEWANTLLDENGKIINNTNVFKNAVDFIIDKKLVLLKANKAESDQRIKNLQEEAKSEIEILKLVALKKIEIEKENASQTDSLIKYLEGLKGGDIFGENKNKSETQAEKEYKALKYSHEMGEITDAEYYNKLAKHRDKFFKKGSDEWREYTLEIKQYQDKLRLETLKEEEDRYKKTLSAITNLIEEQKDKIKEKYDSEINALKELNDQKEKDLTLEKARLNLAKVSTEETRMVFVKGQGFVRKKDIQAIKEAQDEVDKLERVQKIANLENERDTKIKQYQDYLDKWKEVSDTFDNADATAIATKMLGVGWENDIYNTRLDNFSDFRDKYLKIQQSILDAEAVASGKPAVNVLPFAKSYANGGLMDYTGTAMILGSPNRPEIALNNEQAASLYNWVKSLSYPSMKTNSIGSVSRSGGGINISDVKVYPNDFDDFVKQIRTKVNVTGG